MKRHIAKTNLDQRCVVLFMQIPGRESHALICQIDALPPRLEQAVMDVIESAEGQADPVLANVLSRRLLPDTGENLMQALHDRGHLSPIPVDNVLMLPMPNMPFPLRQIIEQMGGTVPQSMQSETSEQQATEKFNPHAAIPQSEANSNMSGTAKNLLIEAQMLEADAKAKREKAYTLAPELRPRTIIADEVAVKTIEKKSRSRAKKIA
jgi:hypothetical protein